MSESFYTGLESAFEGGKADYRRLAILRTLRRHGHDVGTDGHARHSIPDFELTVEFVKDLVDEVIRAHGVQTGPG